MNILKNLEYLYIGGFMKAEIIAIGTEILMGYIVNSNASWIGQQLLDIGIGTYYQQVVGDNESRMIEAIELAKCRSDLIIISGGLGPTDDDITKKIVAQCLNKSLVIDSKQEAKIKDYYALRDYSYLERDANQAAIVSGSQAFFNSVGLACGFGVDFTSEKGHSGVILVIPGPPYEMKEMFTNEVKPYLITKFQVDTHIDSIYLNVCGRGETMVAKDLDDLIEAQTNPTIALYAKPNHVTIRVTASGVDRAEVNQLNQTMADAIIARLGDYFIGYGESYSMEQFIIEKLTENKQTITAAESLTAGLVLNRLATTPGASKVLYGGFVTYMTQSKVELLGVDQEVINKHTVVSEAVARQMAEKSREKAGTDFSIALTGVAGPDSLDGHPAGEVYIALAIRHEETRVEHLNIVDKPRKIVQETAKFAALNLLRHYLLEK